MKEMTDEELNRRLATLHFPQFPVFVAENKELRHHYGVGRSGPAFTYCSDLNAVAIVEAGLTFSQYQRFQKTIAEAWTEDRLKGVTNCPRAPLSASARQRTIALIQTLQP